MDSVFCLKYLGTSNWVLWVSYENTIDKKTAIQENTISKRPASDKAKGTFGFNGNCGGGKKNPAASY